MSNITTVAGLKNSIQMLIEKQEINKGIMKEQVVEVYELFRPVNLIKNILKKITSPSFILENLFGPVLGLVAGYFLRK